MEKVAEYLTKEYLGKLGAVQMGMRMRLRTGYFGARKGVGKGNSLEFSDFKQYAAGDDARKIDWNGYARTGKLFVKQYAEEKQAVVNIFVDASRSMDFGEGRCNKLFYAKMLAASVAYVCMGEGERVNVFAYSDKIKQVRLGCTARNGFAALVKALDAVEPEGTTRQCEAFSSIDVRLGDGVSLILSDFFSQDGYEAAASTLMNKKSMPYMTQILTREELSPQAGESLRLIDSETGQALDVTLDKTSVEAYCRVLSRYQKELGDFCKKRELKCVFAPTDSEMLSTVQKIAAVY